MLGASIWVVWGLWEIELVVGFLYEKLKIVRGAFDRVQSSILLIPSMQFYLMWKILYKQLILKPSMKFRKKVDSVFTLFH